MPIRVSLTQSSTRKHPAPYPGLKWWTLAYLSDPKQIYADNLVFIMLSTDFAPFRAMHCFSVRVLYSSMIEHLYYTLRQRTPVWVVVTLQGCHVRCHVIVSPDFKSESGSGQGVGFVATHLLFSAPPTIAFFSSNNGWTFCTEPSNATLSSSLLLLREPRQLLWKPIVYDRLKANLDTNFHLFDA